MKKQYDFSKGKRGAVIAPVAGKTRITIRLDDEILIGFVAKCTKPEEVTIKR